jgi:predicted transposase/invertase (TIGR01784 family)
MRFISPKTDFAFKRIFGSSEHPEILISFLNAMLYDGEPIIQDIEIIDPLFGSQRYRIERQLPGCES